MTHVFALPGTDCIEPGVAPLITELSEPITVEHCGAADARRPGLARFVRAVFRRAYGAEVTTFCPDLLAFRHGPRLRAVVGYRDGLIKPLFSEHYLDSPAEHLISAGAGRPIDRRHLVEVGNLAPAHPGQTRWLIAATTAYLHAAGYRWVLFTAATSLVNAFTRLGLRPVPLAPAEPRRLPDAGRAWGRYYETRPRVFAGDVHAGMAKLNAAAACSVPRLAALMQAAAALGAAGRQGACNGGVVGGTG